MKPFLTVPAVALSLLLTAPTSVRAQTTPTTPQSEQDHSAHHPGSDQTEAAAPSPGQPSQRGGMQGMMGGDMGSMMPMMAMMHGGGMMGGMPFEHVEGRLAFLKTELKITPEQEPQWNKFADAVRSVAQSMKGMRQQMMQGGQTMQGGQMQGGQMQGGQMQGGQMMHASAQSAPARLDSYERMLTARLEAVRTVKAPFGPLYTSLSDEQKKTADELFGHMGVM